MAGGDAASPCHLFISLIYSPAFSFTWKRRRVSLFSRKSVFTLTLEAVGPVSFFFQARYPAELLSVNWHMQDFSLSFLFFRVTWVRACVFCLNLP